MTYAAEGMGSLTQTGQRSGGLTINSDQQRSGRAFAPGLRKWWIPPNVIKLKKVYPYSHEE